MKVNVTNIKATWSTQDQRGKKRQICGRGRLAPHSDHFIICPFFSHQQQFRSRDYKNVILLGKKKNGGDLKERNPYSPDPKIFLDDCKNVRAIYYIYILF